jgi:methyltransferase (TIGR00027 family)
MLHDRPSLTALAVAGARAIARVDPVAQALVPPALGAVLRWVGQPTGALGRVARAATLGLADHLELRTRALDEITAQAAAEGSRQLVILGAGLDARAWRMTALAESTVFEVDHPSTQAYKRARAASLSLRARALRFVGVDFERDRLDERLAAAGHKTSELTTWLWEGVTPYLTPAAIDATLDVIAARSAPGSLLAMTYNDAALGAVPAPLRALVRPAFVALGEPLLGLMRRAEATERVSSRGFTVEHDEGSAELALRFGLPLSVAARAVATERVLAARKK